MHPSAAPSPRTPAQAEASPTLCSAPSLRLLATTRRQLCDRLARGEPFWLYAYGSLLWKPHGTPAEIRPARLWGHHRALRMRSRVNRGSVDCPGLVFALLPGGSCVGQVHRTDHAEALAQLDSLWEREMPNGVYTPRWLRCHTPQGSVTALAFTLDPPPPIPPTHPTRALWMTPPTWPSFATPAVATAARWTTCTTPRGACKRCRSTTPRCHASFDWPATTGCCQARTVSDSGTAIRARARSASVLMSWSTPASSTSTATEG